MQVSIGLSLFHLLIHFEIKYKLKISRRRDEIRRRFNASLFSWSVVFSNGVTTGCGHRQLDSLSSHTSNYSQATVKRFVDILRRLSPLHPPLSLSLLVSRRRCYIVGLLRTRSSTRQDDNDVDVRWSVGVSPIQMGAQLIGKSCRLCAAGLRFYCATSIVGPKTYWI